MRIRTVVKLIFVLVIALVIAGVAVVFNLDPNDHKGRIVAYIERETGRKLTIDAPITFKWGQISQLGLGDVRLSNPG